jgi:hypothetical protein
VTGGYVHGCVRDVDIRLSNVDPRAVFGVLVTRVGTLSGHRKWLLRQAR